MSASPILIAIAAVNQLVWGFVPGASSIVVAQIPPELFTTVRWTIAGGIFSGFLLFRQRRIARLNRDFALVAALGVLAYGAAQLGMLYGLKLGGIVNFALVAAFNPVLVSAATIVILGERPTPKFFAALALGVVGLIFIVIGKYRLSDLSIAAGAAALILVSQGLDSMTFAFSKKFRNRVSTLQYLAVAQGAAAIFLWTVQLGFLHQASQLSQLTSTGWTALLFVALGAGIGCYGTFYWLLTRMEGHKLSLFNGLFTVSAVASGHLFFHEPLSLSMAIGGAFILASIVLGTWQRAQR